MDQLAFPLLTVSEAAYADSLSVDLIVCQQNISYAKLLIEIRKYKREIISPSHNHIKNI